MFKPFVTASLLTAVLLTGVGAPTALAQPAPQTASLTTTETNFSALDTKKKKKKSGIKSVGDIIRLNINVTANAKADLSVKVASNKKTVKKGKSVEAGAVWKANQELLGFGLPFHLYTQFSMPASTMQRPTLQYTTADLNSLTFSKKYNTVTKQSEWTVSGKSEGLRGKATLETKASAKAAKKGKGHVIGGTNSIKGIPTKNYIHRNTALAITVN